MPLNLYKKAELFYIHSWRLDSVFEKLEWMFYDKQLIFSHEFLVQNLS